MTLYRLNRLFNPRSGRALDVAVDHGFFGERSFLTGIENMDAVVSTLVDAGPDAVQLTIGQARRLQSVPGKQKPGLVLRTDIANVYGNPLDAQLFSIHVPHAIEEAVRLDAVAVCVNLMELPGHPEVREANIRSILELRREATRYGMPLMIEPLVMQDNSTAGGYMVDGDIDKIVTLVRQGVELGADLIKADPSTDLGEYGRVIEVAGDVPVLVRGGGRVDDRTLLERTVAVLAAGARGIVYGRNIVQHENPAGITAALLAVLHDGADVEQGLAILAESDASHADASRAGASHADASLAGRNGASA
ncbi:aldolase [Herbiconiux sp. CPCC 205763]|uniref:Aldolase n=1 Tax=Herbiconiux aconitum TaxID=2970913 RepID=A0ABT2GV55_9MICO|nr:aldolase [Herbiconiux aconitum]MCS5720089.1 aldolase [Herbiconiux aconitum]